MSMSINGEIGPLVNQGGQVLSKGIGLPLTSSHVSPCGNIGQAALQISPTKNPDFYVNSPHFKFVSFRWRGELGMISKIIK